MLLSVFMLNVVMLSDILLSVIMLIVVVLSVVVPDLPIQRDFKFDFWQVESVAVIIKQKFAVGQCNHRPP